MIKFVRLFAYCAPPPLNASWPPLENCDNGVGVLEAFGEKYFSGGASSGWKLLLELFEFWLRSFWLASRFPALLRPWLLRFVLLLLLLLWLPDRSPVGDGDGSYFRGRPLDKWRRFTNSLSSTIQNEPKSSSYLTKHLCRDKFVRIAFYIDHTLRYLFS